MSSKETIRAAFENYDTDKSGWIGKRELEGLLDDLGGNPELYPQALQILDKDQNGRIELKEFENWWLNQTADLDGDGKIGELEKALEKLKHLGMKKFHTDIHTASWDGHVDVVERLLEDLLEAANQPDTTEFGDHNHPLHYAAYNGHQGVVELLLRHKASVNATNDSGCTPLFFAAQQGHAQVVALLLKAGSDSRQREKVHNLSPIDVATSNKVIEAFKTAGGKKPAAPEAPTLSNPTAYTLQMSWEPPVPELGQKIPVSGYKIKIAQENGKLKFMLLPSMPRNATLFDLEPDTSYEVQISAINICGAGEYSPRSNKLVTTRAPPDPPGNLEVVVVGADSVEFSWEMPNSPTDPVQSFVVQSRTKESPWDKAGTAEAASRSTVIADLFSSRAYKFRVAAINCNGMGKFSPALKIVTAETSKQKFKRKTDKLKNAMKFHLSNSKSASNKNTKQIPDNQAKENI